MGLVLAGMVLVDCPVDGAQIDRPNLVVRVYTTAAMHTSDGKRAIREATAILEDADVDVNWLDCSKTATPADAAAVPARCAQPLKSNEVAVRIVRVRLSGHHDDGTLGESLLDAVRRTGTLATIYVDRVEWLARAGGVDTPTVLARAIAHEIGHLLLGTNAHSRRGLMRPVWSREELIRARAGDWLFPAEDARRLQQALARRIDRTDRTPEALIVGNPHESS